MLPLKVLQSGSHGLIGGSLLKFLRAHGAQVTPLERSGSKASFLTLKEGGSLHPFEGFDVWIHLSGENIGKGLWTARRKAEFWKSRCETTSLLSHALTHLSSPPKVILAASALGFYGSCHEGVVVDEQSCQGEGFLAQLCGEWERGWESCPSLGIRHVALRFGTVLSPLGGLLKALLPLYRLGLGGVIGSGKQFISWISIIDVLQVVIYLLEHPEITGPVNVCTPFPVSQKEFARTLSSVLHRPAFCPLPAWIVKCFLREKGRALLLDSMRAQPQQLVDAGYRFTHPSLLGCLQDLL